MSINTIKMKKREKQSLNLIIWFTNEIHEKKKRAFTIQFLKKFHLFH